MWKDDAIPACPTKVTDYEKWKSAFDAHSVIRQAHGSRGGQLFRNAADPNELVVLLEWDVLEQARQFAQSEEFREVMQRAGVVDQPDIYFLKDGEQVSR
jgi:heme-degrading monooxygenase HmoA